MNRLAIVLFTILLASLVSFSAYADGISPHPVTPDISSVIKECVTSNTDNFSVIGKNQQDNPEDFQYRLGESLPIKATGKCAEAIEKTANPNQPKPISLYFDDVQIAVLKKPEPQKIAGSNDIQLNFTLVRNSDDETNRKLWDDFFKKKRYSEYTMDVQPAIEIDNDFPIMVKSLKDFKFYVATNGFIYWTAGICILIFITAFWGLICKTNLLKDETGYYSLGQTQMTFWMLLVALSFAAINIITGTMENIPSQIFQLMGISIGTGGIAIFMTHSKRNSKLAKLEREKKELEEKKKNSDAANPFPSESQKQLDIIENEIKTLNEIKVTDRNGFIHFCEDICGDSNGASFHRFQIVIWTLVLGGTFVNSVMQIMSMPEFSQDLLILMGVSSVTYLGFKFPEKPKT